ncbi:MULTISPECIES: hypothetical protein [unclassified Mesorhizobium]|uniref:hypothetical protein n=1 Tax=unclassified Mesorhizobium TaxID=325217 RepID=UPI0015E42E53|nr:MULTISPECIES: hypothetical protein [unclassified Mesorhizobium]
MIFTRMANACSAASLTGLSALESFVSALFPAAKPAAGCMPLLPGTCTLAAYFLGGISAGRYREISKPAATWHMVGFFQLFFMAFSSSASPKGPVMSLTPLRAVQWLVHHFTNGQMKHRVLKTTKENYLPRRSVPSLHRRFRADRAHPGAAVIGLSCSSISGTL